MEDAIIKAVDRNKVEKLIKSIENSNFDENTIDLLLMKLRPYSKNILFNELANFVAHGDERDSGMVTNSLRRMYLRMKYFNEFNSPKKTLNLSEYFPSWIKELLLLQLEICDFKKLRKDVKLAPTKLEQEINRSFEEKYDSNELITLKKEKYSNRQLFLGIEYLLSFLSGKPIFNQKDVMKAIFDVIKKNHLEFDEKKFKKLENKIILCILLLMHKVPIKIIKSLEKKGNCEISAENNTGYNEEYGNLIIHGSVPIQEYSDQRVIFAIMTTELDSKKWCEESMIIVEPLSSDPKIKELCKRIRFLDGIRISENFKLENIT